MANKRMFSIKIVDSDAFLDMPLSTQCLYFHLNMRADDDGFIGNPKKIMRIVGSSEDDLKLLIAKRFILIFNDGVIVIKHWRMHNCIQSDRYTPTVYQDEKNMLFLKKNKSYTLDSTKDVSKMETKRIQSVSADIGLDIGLDIDLDTDTDTGIDTSKEVQAISSSLTIPYHTIQDNFNSVCRSYPRLVKMSEKRKKAIRARMKTGYTLEDFKKLFEIAEESEFLKGKNSRNWSADFDWLICDSNMAKTLEGKYDNREVKPSPGPSYRGGEMEGLKEFMQDE